METNLKTNIMKNKQEILDRLVKVQIPFNPYYRIGVDSETWTDPITQKKYYVPIEIVRDFDNLEEII